MEDTFLKEPSTLEKNQNTSKNKNLSLLYPIPNKIILLPKNPLYSSFSNLLNTTFKKKENLTTHPKSKENSL
jgi:hypothetical protein